jgi:hypothetical protein
MILEPFSWRAARARRRACAAAAKKVLKFASKVTIREELFQTLIKEGAVMLNLYSSNLEYVRLLDKIRSERNAATSSFNRTLSPFSSQAEKNDLWNDMFRSALRPRSQAVIAMAGAPVLGLSGGGAQAVGSLLERASSGFPIDLTGGGEDEASEVVYVPFRVPVQPRIDPPKTEQRAPGGAMYTPTGIQRAAGRINTPAVASASQTPSSGSSSAAPITPQAAPPTSSPVAEPVAPPAPPEPAKPKVRELGFLQLLG